MAKNLSPRRDDARRSEHSPPPDRGRGSWKIGVTIGYGIAFFALLTYAMARDKDVLLAFLAGAALGLILILFVWHPEYVKSLRIRVRLYKVRLRTRLDTSRRQRSQPVDNSAWNQKPELNPDAILERNAEIAARKDEQKSKKKNMKSAIRKGQKRKHSP
jgi:hypothetical protein